MVNIIFKTNFYYINLFGKFIYIANIYNLEPSYYG